MADGRYRRHNNLSRKDAHRKLLSFPMVKIAFPRLSPPKYYRLFI